MCARESSAVAEAVRNNGNRYAVIGIPVEYGEDEVLGFINDKGVNGFPHLKNVGSVWSQYGMTSLPSWATINTDGTINSGSGTMPASVLNGDWIS